MAAPNAGPDGWLSRVADVARSADVFDSVRLEGDRLECPAVGLPERAWYRVEIEERRPVISLLTPDRWLSESIESDLLHSGEPVDERLEEELDEAGYEGPPLRVEHFRSPEKLYTFRVGLPSHSESLDWAAITDTASRCLLAFQACFRELGEMSPEDED